MQTTKLVRVWEALAKADPLWAILSDPTKRHGGWEIDEFFASGVEQIGSLVELTRSHCGNFGNGSALDFGCGVGRLTQALCRHFNSAHGIDISSSMIQQARKYNRHAERCEYHLNESDDLELFDPNSFDFICSLLVLQHGLPEQAERYIRGLIRILSPGGALVFQTPSHPADESDEAVSQRVATALPASDLQVEIDVTGWDRAVLAGERREIALKLKNPTGSTWPSREPPHSYPVKIGHRWVGEKGRRGFPDDARTPLPRTLGPGEETEVRYHYVAPTTAGAYVVELDLVQEGVCWFSSRGSDTCRVAVEVRGDKQGTEQTTRPGEEAPNQGSAGIEMHGLHRDIIVEVVKSCGAKLMHMRRDLLAGPEWCNYTYFVTK